MGTTSRGIDYPDPSGIPARSDLQELAESVNAALDTIMSTLGLDGQRVQHGTFVLSVGTANADSSVSFSPPFSGVPRVFCTVIDTAIPSSGHRSDTWGPTAGDTGGGGSTTGFVFRSRRNTGTANVRVNWIAIGPA